MPHLKGQFYLVRAVPVTLLDQSQSQFDTQTLLSFLADEGDLAQALVLCAQKKQDAILSRDHVAFEQVLAEEGPLIGRLQQTEQARATWLADRAPHQHQTLSDILPLLPPSVADEVAQSADRLVQSIQKLDALNQQNAGLIIHSLAHVRMLVSALVGDAADVGSYGPSSSAPNPSSQSKSLVDWRA